MSTTFSTHTTSPSTLAAHLNYGLLGLGLFTGWLAAVFAVIIAYVKLNDVRGTALESHYRWQIRTFWWGLLWTALGGLLFVLIIGALGPSYLIWGVAWIWGAYRVIKGWLRLADLRPVA
jgi:uncharacterized membrane protein